MSATVAIDVYVFKTLMRDLVGHDRRPSAFLVYLALAAEGSDGRRSWTHLQLAEQTGLSKRAVQAGLEHLASRGLVRVTRSAPTEPAVIEALIPWRRLV